MKDTKHTRHTKPTLFKGEKSSFVCFVHLVSYGRGEVPLPFPSVSVTIFRIGTSRHVSS
jgi:hypothetical protein